MTEKPEAERFVPELMSGGVIEAEHRARYAFALPHVAGRIVLDAGCGVGWGSALAVAAGAREVIGIDIADDAVLDARSRAPGARFIKADMMAVPLPDDSVDVIICMEALEHTTDTARTLDELVRVLRPDGLLFVSSPNPEVYPAGNPFHVHELRPEELLSAVKARLEHVVLHRQHTLITSVVLPDDENGPGEVTLHSELAVSLPEGHDPYSIVVASGSPLPQVGAVEVLVPSQQLTDLDALATSMTDERRTMHEDRGQLVAEVERLRDEGKQIAAEAERLRAENAEADAGLQRLMAEKNQYAGLVAEVERLRDENAEAHAGLQRIMAEVAQYGVDAEVSQERMTQLRAERDRFAASLLSSEQALARAVQAAARH